MPRTEQNTDYLIMLLLSGFSWFDDGLQAYLQAGGWNHITRPQSMVMIHVLSGNNKPSAIARKMGISRQAAHTTISQMVKLGMLTLNNDPADGRAKIVVVTEKGRAMREHADEAARRLTDELRTRIGSDAVENLFNAFAGEWGAVPSPDLSRWPSSPDTKSAAR